MAFGHGSVKTKGKIFRVTQRSHTNAIQRINAARAIRRTKASQAKASQAKASQAKAPQAKAPHRLSVVKSPQNERGSAPDRGTLRANQAQISISLVNNKLDKLLELLKVDDHNTNTITTFEQLNVRLDNLIETIKEDSDKYGISKSIEQSF
jgi:ATP-dependent Lon protease